MQLSCLSTPGHVTVKAEELHAFDNDDSSTILDLWSDSECEDGNSEGGSESIDVFGIEPASSSSLRAGTPAVVGSSAGQFDLEHSFRSLSLSHKDIEVGAPPSNSKVYSGGLSNGTVTSGTRPAVIVKPPRFTLGGDELPRLPLKLLETHFAGQAVTLSAPLCGSSRSTLRVSSSTIVRAVNRYALLV
jgi:hypothetical protein